MSNATRKAQRAAARPHCNHVHELERLRDLEQAVLAYNDAEDGSLKEAQAKERMQDAIRKALEARAGMRS